MTNAILEKLAGAFRSKGKIAPMFKEIKEGFLDEGILESLSPYQPQDSEFLVSNFFYQLTGRRNDTSFTFLARAGPKIGSLLSYLLRYQRPQENLSPLKFIHHLDFIPH